MGKKDPIALVTIRVSHSVYKNLFKIDIAAGATEINLGKV
jgi:hypothetical protein